MARLPGCLVFLLILTVSAVAQTEARFDDNVDSVAVVIGNELYKHVGNVEYAQRDAEAVGDYLKNALHFGTVKVESNLTKSELERWFGTKDDLHGELWRQSQEGHSNVFVYYSGHGVPDSSGHSFLLASDVYSTDPTPGYPLELLYRSLEEVKRKIGPDRQVIVMLDACFTGENGRGKTLFEGGKVPPMLSSSPKGPDDIIKVLATSGTTPAYWDDQKKLGLFTSRFLMGVAGIPAGGASNLLSWGTLKEYVGREVRQAALDTDNADQMPEIDNANIDLPIMPVGAVKEAVAAEEELRNWHEIERANSPTAYKRYLSECKVPCDHKVDAQKHLDDYLWMILHDASYLTECAKQDTGCFHKSEVAAVPPPEQAPPLDRCPSLFDSARTINTVAAYQEFLTKCPNDPAAAMANKAIETLQTAAPPPSQPASIDRCPSFFDTARLLNTVAAYREFLTKCPNDAAVDMANRAIETLQIPRPNEPAPIDRCPSFFDTARSINTVSAYQGFVAQCPKDPAVDMANRAISALQTPSARSANLETPAIENPRTSPSFDCNRAIQPSEIAICGDNQLAQLDQELARAYNQRRTALSGQVLRTLVKSEIQWITYRNARCNSNKPCLLAEIQSRIDQLRGF
jgi:uncharacterized protein YecT (DUF1311 family)